MRLAAALVLVVSTAAATARAEPCAPDAELDGPSTKPHDPAISTRAYLGKTAKQIVAAHGEPGCKSARMWRYWLPDACAYDKDVITLRFANGKVARATVVHIVTGEECAFDQ